MSKNNKKSFSVYIGVYMGPPNRREEERRLRQEAPKSHPSLVEKLSGLFHTRPVAPKPPATTTTPSSSTSTTPKTS